MAQSLVTSVTSFGILKVPLKVAKISSDFLCYLKNITFKVKTSVVMFWQLLEEIGLLYNLTSGHNSCYFPTPEIRGSSSVKANFFTLNCNESRK